MTYAKAFALLWSHLWGAGGMAPLFAAGMLLAVPIYRRRIRVLLALPKLFAAMLHHILERNPTTLHLGTFIFVFNSCAIFLYMLTGIVPRLPAAMALFTGLNVALTSIIAQKQLPRPPAFSRRTPDIAIPVTAQIGAVLTFLLELPCLWFALAIGFSITPSIAGILRGKDITPLRERVLTYAMIIVPVLAVSAFAEAHAVCWAFRAARSHPNAPPDGSESSKEDE